MIIKIILKPFSFLYFYMRFLGGSIFRAFLSLYCYKSIKVYLCNHFTMGIWSLYKKGTIFPHPVGIVIGLKVEMGYNCIIYQNVTIGTKDTVDYLNSKYPKIGNNVTIFPNSIVIGDVLIGDNSIVGAGTIVRSNIPANCVAYGEPLKIKKTK